MNKVGIKTDDANRIRVRGELIVGDVKGLVADLGKGYFVVTKQASEELTRRGVVFTEVEIISGCPKCGVCGKMYRKILYPRSAPVPEFPFEQDCDCENEKTHSFLEGGKK